MSLSHSIHMAVDVLRQGGLIAYPTEFCYGLGCDPENTQAIERLLAVKGRLKNQGVILIAANITQVSQYADLDALANRHVINQSWPGPNTWLLPALDSVSSWVKGEHTSVAMRIPEYHVCHKLCLEFGGAIVSTSANRHAQPSILDGTSVMAEFADDVDYVINAPVQFDPNQTTQKASIIRDALTGQQLR